MNIDTIPLPLRATTKEIRRLCDELEAIVGKDPQRVGEIRQPYSTQPDCSLDDADLVDFAQLLIKERDKRNCHFRNIEFFDPSWSILLDLFVNQLLGRNVSVSSLCIAAGVPPTTALRYISSLTSTEVLLRIQDPHDARRVYMRLCDGVIATIKTYLRETLSARLAFDARYAAPNQRGR